MAEPEQVKVAIETDGEIETLWGERVGPNRYRLDNLSFFAYGVSWGDIVEGEEDDNNMVTFARVVEKSGHRTIRIGFEEDVPENKPILDRLNALGATYEGAYRFVIAVDIPPDVDMDAILTYLDEEEAMWEHADPTYEELYPDAK